MKCYKAKNFDDMKRYVHGKYNRTLGLTSLIGSHTDKIEGKSNGKVVKNIYIFDKDKYDNDKRFKAEKIKIKSSFFIEQTWGFFGKEKWKVYDGLYYEVV